MSVEYTAIQIEIARQIHVQKPDHLEPGKDIGFSPLGDHGIEVQIMEEIVPGQRAILRLARRVIVTYCEGSDDYAVRVEADGQGWDFDRVYCDQLGGLVFGDEAKPFAEPMAMVFEMNDDGTAGERIA